MKNYWFWFVLAKLMAVDEPEFVKDHYLNPINRNNIFAFIGSFVFFDALFYWSLIAGYGYAAWRLLLMLGLILLEAAYLLSREGESINSSHIKK